MKDQEQLQKNMMEKVSTFKNEKEEIEVNRN